MRQQQKKNSWAIGLLIFILMLGFTITSMLSYTVTKEYVVSSAINQTLPLISDNIYSEIKKELLDPINVSSLMANDEFLVNWVLDGEKDQDAIVSYLKRIKERYGYTSAFFVSDKTGNYYYYDGILKQISKNDAHDVWYYDFKALNQPVALDVDTDEARQGTLTVFINHRLESEAGTFLGATGVGLELTNVGDKLQSYEEQFDHSIYLVDSNGLIQIHSNPDLVGKVNILDNEGIKEIAGSILYPSDEIHVYEYKDAGELKAISIRYIPEFNWYLVVEKNQERSLLQAKTSLWRNIAIGFIVTILISLLIILVFKTYNRRLEQLASIDELTHVYNRRYFIQLLDREISIAKRYGQPLSLLMLDIDNFKFINDQYGHLIGDDILRMIANTIKNTVRESDLVGRWGGEEFVVLLINAGEKEALRTAERIVKNVSESTLETNSGDLYRTVSIGVSVFDATQMNREDLFQKADEALLKAKEMGKNTAQI